MVTHGSRVAFVGLTFMALAITTTLVDYTGSKASAAGFEELRPTYLVEGIAVEETQEQIDTVVTLPLDSSDAVIEVGLTKTYMASNLAEIEEQGLYEGDINYEAYDIEISSVDIAETQKELARIAEEERVKAEQERIAAEEAAKAEALRIEQAQAALAAKDAQSGAFKDIPSYNTGFKAFMDYGCLTSKSSTQYKLQHDGNATTNEEGFRMYNGEYMVAVGSYYAKYCGIRLRITLDTGKQFYAIVGDQKADIHTDALNQHRNGNIVEFIVDYDKIPKICKQMGDMSYAPNAGLQGKIASIEVLG